MEDTFRFSDDFGPTHITYIHQPSLALKAIVVIDTIDDRAGIAMWSHEDLTRHRLLRPD